MYNTPSDNGLSLGQHTFVLFISIVLSVLLHFGILYFCGDLAVTEPPADKVEKITPMELPPVTIERFVQQAQLLSAETVQMPDATSDVSQVEARIAEHAETAKIPLPANLPTPELPEDQLPGDILNDIKPDAPSPPDPLVRQEVASVPETELTKITNPDPRWEVNAATPLVNNAPDLAPTHELVHGVPDYADDFHPAIAGTPFGTSDDLFANLTSTETAMATAEIFANATVEGGMAEGLAEARDATQTEALLEAAVEQAQPELNAKMPAFQAIDERLNLSLQVYQTPQDPIHNYFQLSIVRRPESPMPIMPKDVVFIQDISGSIGKKRLEHIKVATKSAIFNTLRAGDRFNIFAFRDVTLTPSSTWMTFNPETRVRADKFIDSLRSRGNTDFFLLLQDLLTLPRDPNRPLVAVVVTDGEATAGVTETTRIIGEFSRMNQGNISIYTFDAKRRNPYFLDMLCYSNRGENTTASNAKNIEGLGSELKPVFESIRNPVMKDVTLTFDGSSKGEIHPNKLTNLYADRALMIYGRVPRTVTQVTCQLRGTSANETYDAVFNFSVNDAIRTQVDLRKAWAERAMFDLLAQYAENPSTTLRGQINRFAKNYNVRDPYAEGNSAK